MCGEFLPVVVVVVVSGYRFVAGLTFCVCVVGGRDSRLTSGCK